MTQHSQFGEGAKPDLCMDEWNRPTPVRGRLSLTQAVRGKLVPTGLALVLSFTKFFSFGSLLRQKRLRNPCNMNLREI